MTAEVITFRVKQRTRPGQMIAGRDFLIIREDGSFGFVPEGTVLANRIEDGPPEIDNEDWAAEQRLAQAALERD